MEDEMTEIGETPKTLVEYGEEVKDLVAQLIQRAISQEVAALLGQLLVAVGGVLEKGQIHWRDNRVVELPDYNSVRDEKGRGKRYLVKVGDAVRPLPAYRLDDHVYLVGFKGMPYRPEAYLLVRPMDDVVWWTEYPEV